VLLNAKMQLLFPAVAVGSTGSYLISSGIILEEVVGQLYLPQHDGGRCHDYKWRRLLSQPVSKQRYVRAVGCSSARSSISLPRLDNGCIPFALFGNSSFPVSLVLWTIDNMADIRTSSPLLMTVGHSRCLFCGLFNDFALRVCREDGDG